MPPEVPSGIPSGFQLGLSLGFFLADLLGIHSKVLKSAITGKYL